ncbi:MAG: hypothetical protein PHI06_12080 [Desulfobulbaceae bacterium]|nr:hypothetical protein [Desulfobulbaceae bacterium]
MTQRRWGWTHFTLATLTLLACWHRPTNSALANTLPLPSAIQSSRFIAYTPRSFSITAGEVVAASRSGIADDLKLLRPFFDGLITYSSANGIEAVPMIAKRLDFRAIILGIWDPTSATEIQNVLLAIKKYPTLISAVIVGNEGIYSKRYQPEDVQKAIQRLKKESPSLPTTTSEPFSLYFQDDLTPFFRSHDLLMPNVHPVFEKWFSPGDPQNGVAMVVTVAARLEERYPSPLFIKETGMPSGEEQQGFSSRQQALFWAGLFKKFPFSKTSSFACFEAFDAPWKPTDMARILPGNHANEAYWGFFNTAGTGKMVLDSLPKLIEEKTDRHH